jgi:hypothetical protein
MFSFSTNNNIWNRIVKVPEKKKTNDWF